MAPAAAETEPTAVAEEPVFAVAKETERKGREGRAGGHAVESRNLPAPHRGPGVVDDQRAGLIGNNPGHLGNSGIRD